MKVTESFKTNNFTQLSFNFDNSKVLIMLSYYHNDNNKLFNITLVADKTKSVRSSNSIGKTFYSFNECLNSYKSAKNKELINKVIEYYNNVILNPQTENTKCYDTENEYTKNPNLLYVMLTKEILS